MIQVFFPFITAIGLSVVAAYYSVIGLAQIFPGSFWPIILMGSILEVSKLVTVSWLYNNWKETAKIMKYYFLIAIILLMTITSMGIFGYLSRAKDPSTASNKLDKQIQETQAELKKLSTEKLPLLKEENQLMAEVGPIKYIAEIFYTKDDPGFIDKAVRLVIFTIIIVFDPLAVLLLIAANQTYKKLKQEEDLPQITPKKVKKKKVLDTDPVISVESFMDNEIIPKHKITKMDGGSF